MLELSDVITAVLGESIEHFDGTVRHNGQPVNACIVWDEDEGGWLITLRPVLEPKVED